MYSKAYLEGAYEDHICCICHGLGHIPYTYLTRFPSIFSNSTMCGILLCTAEQYEVRLTVASIHSYFQTLNESYRSAINRRGPDLSGNCPIALNGCKFTAHCSVLSQQGSQPCPQPLKCTNYILLWNGEMYDHDASHSDTQIIADRLQACDGSIESVLDIFRQINGPFTFIMLQLDRDRIFFGRDKFGRRSLVCNSGLTLISNLAPPEVYFLLSNCRYPLYAHGDIYCCFL